MPMNNRTDRFRPKYIHRRLERTRPLSRAQRERFEKTSLSITDRALLNLIAKEKNADRLKKLLEKAKQRNLSQQTQKEQIRLQKMTEARKQLQKAIKTLANQPQSAERTKDNMTNLMRGRVKNGLKGMANMARYGAFGSKHTRAAEQFTRAAGDLKQYTSDKDFRSVLSETLKRASTPMTSYEQIKDVDGRDKNLEGRKSEKSNQRQMAEIRIRRANYSYSR